MLWEMYAVFHVGMWIACVSRWAKRYNSGIYNIKGQPDADEAFMGHFFMGLLWPLGLAYLIGAAQNERQLAAEKRAKELAAAEARADRILAENGYGRSDG